MELPQKLEDILNKNPPFVVYILECKAPGYVYVGYTNDFRRRIREHINGYGADFTKKYGVKRVMYLEAQQNRQRAMFRETVMTLYCILNIANFDNVGGGKYPEIVKSYKKKEEIVKVLKDYLRRVDLEKAVN